MDLRTFQLLNRVLDVIERVALTGVDSEGAGAADSGTVGAAPAPKEDEHFISDDLELSISEAANDFLRTADDGVPPRDDAEERESE